MPQLSEDGTRTVARIKGDRQLLRHLAELAESGAERLHMQDLGVDRASGLAQWVVVSQQIGVAYDFEPAGPGPADLPAASGWAVPVAVPKPSAPRRR